MTLCGVRLACLLLVSCLASGQKFPMRYLADIGHLKKNETINVGAGRIRATDSSASLTGRDRAGKPWIVSLAITGGVGWTEVWSADFDADGQRDLLFGRLSPGNGSCVDGLELTVILFDGGGRPMPWVVFSFLPPDGDGFPYLPVLAMDVDRDGRAEFVITDCERGPYGPGSNYSIKGIYEANAGRFDIVTAPNLKAYRRAAGPLPAKPSQWRDRMPGLDGEANQRVEELAMNTTGSGEEMQLSGQRVKQWPDNIVLDGPEGREICLDGCWRELRQVLRYGYAVKWIDPGEETVSWLWADLYQPAKPARVDVVLEVTDSKPMPVTITPVEAGCFQFLYDTMTVRRCPASGTWSYTDGGTRQELLRDKRSVRTAHTAMDHTATNETRLERPPGGGALKGVGEMRETLLAQWKQSGHCLFSLHDPSGELLAWQVRVPVVGDLVAYHEGLVFLSPHSGKVGHLTLATGRFRWRRV